MKIFLEKHAFKILAYVIVLFILIRISIFTNLNKTTIIAILAFINPIFILFIGKPLIDDYKDKSSVCTLVTKLQFELEFNSYKEIYAELMTFIYDFEKIEKQTISKNLYLKKISKFDLIILKVSPFVDDKMYSKLFFISEGLKEKSENAQTSENGLLFLNNFIIKQTNDLSDLIRKRIATMKIIGN